MHVLYFNFTNTQAFSSNANKQIGQVIKSLNAQNKEEKKASDKIKSRVLGLVLVMWLVLIRVETSNSIRSFYPY